MSMTCKWEHIVQRIEQMPMVAVVVPFAIGICVAEVVDVPLWATILLLVSTLVGRRWVGSTMRKAMLMLAVAVVGMVLHATRQSGNIDYDRRQQIRLHFEEHSTISRGRSRTAARIIEAESHTLEGCRIVVWSDSTRRFSAGDKASVTTSIRRFNPKYESYARLMFHRGFVGSASVGEPYDIAPSRYKTLHEAAVERLSAIVPHDNAGAVVVAMTTGSRDAITPELRRAYSLSGASHILAVSGMHVGILFLLINLLVYPLGILPHGNILKSAVAIVAVWGFVVLCGLPPSAVRAAIMFSALQLSLHIPGRYSSGNIWAATAFVMLLCDSHLLFDISAQLSFLAVGGIIFWGVPLCRLLRTHRPMVDMLTATLVVGAVATVATMPLIANVFGIVSIVGIALNPLVILLAYAILLAGISALAIPSLAVVAHLAARLLNGAAEWVATHPSFYLEFSPEGWQTALIYTLYGAITVVIWSIGRKKRLHIDDNL